MKAIKKIVKEIIDNRFRIISIAKYEILGEARESKLGLFWNIANPCIQLFTYWFVFGIGLRNGRPVRGVPFLAWMLVGMCAWFFISPSILKGTSSIYSKKNIISKIKFPAVILPIISVFKELFNNLFMLVIILLAVWLNGVTPTWNWLWILYYLVCSIAMCIALTMVLSVLNMFSRDVKKLVSASMRMLMYLTPILWTMSNLEKHHHTLVTVLKINPLYYIVEGYRGAIFFNDSPLNHPAQNLFFWGMVIVLFIIGCHLFIKNKERFIDMY